ncbi:MAG: preprotein translocase subunit SecY [bacterium]
MSKLTETFGNIIRIQELRERLLFTAAILIVCRIGAHITLPGVDGAIVALTSKRLEGGLFGLYDTFVGGALANAAIFALGIMPYISSSIVIQLLGAVFPYFQKLQKEGEDGRKKITQYTRYGTVLIAALQAIGVAISLQDVTAEVGGSVVPIVPHAGALYYASTIIVLTAGTMFMMWLGEQITERGIGNGISLIIFIGIIARFPAALFDEIQLVMSGKNLIIEMVVWVVLGFIVAGVILVTQGTRRIPVQYAKRVIGRKVYGGVTQYIPLRVNTAGVMPLIFAQAIMFIPGIVIGLFPESEFFVNLAGWFHYDSWTYSILYALMIIFFTYFYTAIAFNPKDVADNMKKQGGFIPGIRPGSHTSDFIDNILTKITLPGSVFLAIIAILPTVMIHIGNVSGNFAQFFGGTSLLIAVGVVLDTLQQVESHLLMRHYDGFMKSGKMKGRRS